MRILYLSLTPNMRMADRIGYATHMREVARALAEAGHEVVLSVAGGGAPTGRWSAAPGPAADAGGGATRRADGAKALIPGPLRHLLRDLRELEIDRRARARIAALVEAQGIDAIYERAAMLMTAGVETAARLGVPHLLEINTPIEERRDHHGFPLYAVGRRRQRRQLEQADRIACVSSVLGDYLAERGAARERITVIPNAVRAAAFTLGAAERAAERRALALGDGDVALGFVGRFGFWHGMPALVEALTRVLGERRRARAVLVGDGQLMPEVRRRIAASGVGERFTLTGAVDWRRASRLAAALDVGIMASSNWYGSPLKIFEYGAAGLCVVAPRVAPVSEVMEEGIDGVLVEPGSADDLARVLIELVDDASRRRALAARFHARVLAEYSWARVAERIGAILAASPRRRAPRPATTPARAGRES